MIGGELESGTRAPILIVGVGNILLGDEGVGVRVIEAMERLGLPRGVDIMDGGTASMALLDILSDRDTVVVIDAVQGGRPPGTVYRLDRSDISSAGGGAITSLHEVDLPGIMIDVELMGRSPRNLVLYGVEPGSLEPGLELTREVQAAIPRVIDSILNELKGQRSLERSC